MGKSWGRLYAGTRHHRKIMILRERHPASWWIWYPLIEMAVDCDDGGLVYVSPDTPFTEKELARELCLPSRRLLNATLTTMKTLKLIELDAGFIRLLSYSDRQFESDSSKERTRNYRERQREKGMEEDREGGRGDVTVTSITEQNKTEHINNPPTPLNDSPPSQPSADSPPQGEGDGGSGKRRPKKADRALAPYSPEFEKFWQVYPNKLGGKEKAWEIWQRRLKKGTLPPFNYLMECIYKLTQDPDWMKEDGKYVPMLTSFLNQGRWSDVEGLKKSRAGPKETFKPVDPNCGECKGKGLVPTIKDGKPSYKMCKCRRV